MAELTKVDLAARRERRAERRQKQRKANIVRAEKMHEVRIAVGAEAAPHERVAGGVYIGCSGWYYWHWKGSFYPTNVPSDKWFDIYQDQFGTVELNAPFYSWPTIGAVKTWIRQSNQGFVYTVKVCELITHIKRFAGTETLIADFGYIGDLLGPQMGCFLFQFPPSVHYTPEMLSSIVSQLDPHRRNVVEFRHKSWWNEHVYDAFTSSGVIFCSCSGPRLPDELVQTSDDIYIRFHGLTQWYRHDYTDAELGVWVDRISASTAKTVWIYFNNDRDGNSIKNAKRLAELMG